MPPFSPVCPALGVEVDCSEVLTEGVRIKNQEQGKEGSRGFANLSKGL